MQRSDEAWLDELGATRALAYEPACTDLRRLLRGALARGFARQLSESDLDDLTQESLLRVHQRLTSFARQCRFTTWATTIAVNCALSELRRRRYEHVSLDDAHVQARASLSEEAASAPREHEQDLELLQQGIAVALTERQREALLARLGGLPLVEIARRLGTTQGAIYKLLHDARRRLKSHLEAARSQDDDLERSPIGPP